jgi:hypothetical protein
VQRHQEQLSEGDRQYGLFREDWPGLGPELELEDPKQRNRIQKVQSLVVDGGKTIFGQGLRLLQGPFGGPHQTDQLHEMDSGQQQQQWQQHERQQWQAPTPTTAQFNSAGPDFSPAAHSPEMLLQLPPTPTTPQPPCSSIDSPRLYHSQFFQDSSNADDWYPRRDSIASNPRQSTRSGLGSSLGSRQRPSSIASSATTNARWQEPPVALSVTEAKVGERQRLKLGGTANAVVLAPDCSFAGFVFEREVHMASIDTQGAGGSDTSTSVLRVDKKAQPFACAAISRTLIVGITYDSQMQIKKHSTLASSIPLQFGSQAPGFRPTCAAFSFNSTHLAIGFRPTTDRSEGIVKVYAILEGGPGVRDIATFKLPEEGTEEPKVVGFWEEGKGVIGVICGGMKRIIAWKSEGDVWGEGAPVVDRTLRVPVSSHNIDPKQPPH